MFRQYGLICVVGALLAFLLLSAIAPYVHGAFTLAAKVVP